MLPLVSIIIPFYNEERLLARAITSALAQTYKNIELILVNDGSTDASQAVATGYLSRNPAIILVNNTHNSLGHARNSGVRKASGTYITFLDSDDELEPDAVGVMVSALESASADAVICAFGMYDDKGRLLKITRPHITKPVIGAADAAIAVNRQQLSRVAWAKLFKADIARGIAFPEGLWFEDGPYLMHYLYRCTLPVALIPIPVVRQYCRPDSITRQLMSPKRIRDTYRVFELELELSTHFAACRDVTQQVFAYYQRALLDNLVLLHMDRGQLAAREEAEKTFTEVFTGFLQHKRRQRPRSGPRTLWDSWLMQLPARIGWPLFYRVFPLLKKRLFREVAAVRAVQAG